MKYSQAELNFMRQDALRRTREMHNRSRQQPNYVQVPPPPPERQEKEEEKKCEEQPEACRSQPQKPLGNLLSGFFRDGKIDNDKIIIIALILILAKEGADLKLLIALGYIMM